MSPSKIILWVGVVVALAAAFVTVPYAALALALVGIVHGVLDVNDDNLMAVSVTAVALATVSGALGAIPVAGDYISAIMGNVGSLVAAAAVTGIAMSIKDKLLG